MEHLSNYYIFYAVAKSGSFSHAAKKLYISQPAVSKSIKALESALKTPLFIRNARGVTLTAEGEILYQHISRAFSAIQDGERKLERNRELETGQLRIGASTTLCRHILLPLLQRFIQEYPHVKINIDCLSSAETATRLAENKLDLGITVETSASRQLDFTPIKQLSYTFVASSSYLDNLRFREQADYTKNNRDFFRNATLMLMDQGNISRQHAETYFLEHHIDTGQILETSNMELLVEFAKIGLGVACVIRDLVETDIEKGTLSEIPLTTKIPSRTVGIAYSGESAFNPSVLKFQTLLTKNHIFH